MLERIRAGSLSDAADALLALRDGEHGPRARAGAMMISETLIAVRAFLTKS